MMPMVALQGCTLRPGATEAEVASAEAALGTALPRDYRQLLLESNGLEGFVASEAYLSLWSVNDLASLNEGYAVAEFLPDVVLFGTDGGDTGYGFTVRDARVEYIAVPLVGMEPGAMTSMGRTLEALLDRLLG